MSSDQEIRLNAVLDWLEKGHITTTQAAARIDPGNRQVMHLPASFAGSEPMMPGTRRLAVVFPTTISDRLGSG